MDVAYLSSVYDVVGGDQSFVTFVTPWKPSNKIKVCFLRLLHTYLSAPCLWEDNSPYFLSRVSNPFVLCRSKQQSIFKE